MPSPADNAPDTARERALRIEKANLALTLSGVRDDLLRLERARTHRLVAAGARALRRFAGRPPNTRGALDRALRRLEALEAARAAPVVSSAVREPGVAFCVGSGPGSPTGTGGDLPFAQALAAAVSRRGRRGSAFRYGDWEGARDAGAVVQLRGRGGRLLSPERFNTLWILSHPEEVTPAECDTYDLVMVASPLDAPRIASSTRTPVRVLEQAADPGALRPGGARDVPVVFVGNRRGRRPLVEAVAAALPELQVWGAGWDGVLDASQWRGSALAPADVADLYASSLVVLSDHWPAMRERGYLANRVYDALAAGAWVVSDAVAGVEPERFGGALLPCGTVEEAVERVRELLGRGSPAPAEAAAAVRREHTFDQRAETLLGWLSSPGSPG